MNKPFKEYFKETRKYKLIEPVTDPSSGQIVEELTFVNRFKSKHMRDLSAIGDLNFGALMDVIGSMTGTLPHVMDELSSKDITNLMDILSDFF